MKARTRTTTPSRYTSTSLSYRQTSPIGRGVNREKEREREREREKTNRRRRPSPFKPPTVLTTAEIKQKEKELSLSLREAESRQLAAYLKNRSAVVDHEIDQTRKKLNLSLDLSPNGKNYQTTRGPVDLSTTESYSQQEYEMKIFLKRLQQSMDDSQMTPAEITACFLPSQHLKLNQGIISLKDAVDVFHVDLVQPLSKQDQALLLMGYGTDKSGIDIQTLLQDLDYWDPKIPTSIPSTRYDLDDDLDEELPAQYRLPSPQKKPNVSPTRKMNLYPSDDSGVRGQRSLNENALADIHSLVNDSYSLSPNRPKANLWGNESETETDEDILKKLRTEVEKEKALISQSVDLSDAPKNDSNSIPTQAPKDETPADKTLEQVAAENVARALAVENAKLKAELSAFDREFFEELEDLKLKYADLQTTLNTQTPASPRQENRTKLSPRTIGRLGKSARTSLQNFTRFNDEDKPSGRYDQESPNRNKQTTRSNFAWNLTTPHSIPLGKSNDKDRGFVPISLQSSLRESLSNSLTGTGTNDNFGSLCERRLQFELQHHSDPGRATKTLLHAIGEAAHREHDEEKGKESETKGYIKPNVLADIFQQLGLSFTRKEIDILCTGFASDGKGGIDALELSQMIQALMYQSLSRNKEQPDDPNKFLEETLRSILQHIVEVVFSQQSTPYPNLIKMMETFPLSLRSWRDIIQTPEKRKKYLTKIMIEVKKILFRIFSTVDRNQNGLILSKGFQKVLLLMCENLSDEDIQFLSEYYIDHSSPSNSPVRKTSLRDHNDLRTGLIVAYDRFIDDFSFLLADQLLESQHQTQQQSTTQNVAVTQNVSFPWLLREFDLVDDLLSQLEAMNSTSGQRKILLHLQRTYQEQGTKNLGTIPRTFISEANDDEEGYLDGYSIIKGLLSVGFQISRDKRKHFLKNVEKFPGHFHANDLCLILASICIDWTSHERFLWGKILSALGPINPHRRKWFYRFKNDLLVTSQHMVNQLRKGRKDLNAQTLDDLQMDPENSIKEFFPLSPSLFLYCLRENEISFSIDEEATLLDCLMFESSFLSTSPWNLRDCPEYEGSNGEIPSIMSKNFLDCSQRFVGKWYDSAPRVSETIRTQLVSLASSSSNPPFVLYTAIKDLESLFRAFDKTATLSIEFRPFVVSCRRSALFQGLELPFLEELARLVVEDGEGLIRYPQFLLHLRALSSEILKSEEKVKSKIMQSDDLEAFNTLEQLLQSGSDSLTGTLKPLRQVLLQRHQSEGESNLPLTSRDITELMQEFHVQCTSQELEVFLETISNSRMVADYFHETPGHLLHYHPQNQSSQNLTTRLTVPSLIHSLQQLRSSWTYRNHRLAKKIRKYLSKISSSAFRKLLTRMIAFSRASLISGMITRQNEDDEVEEDLPRHNLDCELGSILAFISGGLFQTILQNCGLQLDDQEIYFLCDESDASLNPTMIRLSVLFEVFTKNEETESLKSHLNDLSLALQASSKTAISRKKFEDPLSALFALEHLKGLLNKSRKKFQRTEGEWKNDVMTLMNGFDLGGGVVLTEDFVLGLSIVNVRLSEDILNAIPTISLGLQFIPYKEIFNVLFAVPLHDLPSDSATVQLTRDTSRSVVPRLINLVRKRLNMFLGQQKDTEQAWNTLLKVFLKFDPKSDNFVTPRDFCLAVSVLMDGDSPVFTKYEWEEVISHYHVKSTKGRGVDYIRFLDDVLEIDSDDRAVMTRGVLRDSAPSWITGEMKPSQSFRPNRSGIPFDSPTQQRRDREIDPLEEERDRLRGSKPNRTVGQTSRLNSLLSKSANMNASWLESSMSASGSVRGKEKPKVDGKKRFPANYGPEESRSDYYFENEEDYNASSTLSGRGVVGSSFQNRARSSQLAKTAIPRVGGKYDELFGPLPSTIHSISSADSLVGTMPTTQLKFLSAFDTFSIKELNSELYDALTGKLAASTSLSTGREVTRKDLLIKYLEMEDKNHSGTLTKHSMLAALNALGISHYFWTKQSQKEIIDELLEQGNGMIAIKDFLKLILFK